MHNTRDLPLGCNKARCMLLSIMLLITTSIVILSLASHIVFSASVPDKRAEIDVAKNLRDSSRRPFSSNSEELSSKIVGSSLLRAGSESISQV